MNNPEKTGNTRYTRHWTKTNKTKTQYNMCWTPLCTNNINKARTNNWG